MKITVWKEFCRLCHREHYVSHQLCVSCSVYTVPAPIFSGVANACEATYECDGCVAYRTTWWYREETP